MEIKPKLIISTNRNKTKEGIKVQFSFPNQIEGDQKTLITQKLQNKLNTGLAKNNLTANIDTDVPFSNVIGFTIPIGDIKMLIKNALSGNDQEQQRDNQQN